MDIVGERRLLKLANILDTADADHRAKKKPTYIQVRIRHACGTPACAMGHWIPHTHGRIVFTKEAVLVHRKRLGLTGVREVGAAEFRITRDQSDELFSDQGCGKARTAKQAAKYIRRFVKRVKQSEAHFRT